MTKHRFLDMIKSKAANTAAATTGKKDKAFASAAATAATLQTPKKWNALQDDYLLNSKLKDWDKESSSDEDEEDDNGNNKGLDPKDDVDAWSDDDDDNATSNNKNKNKRGTSLVRKAKPGKKLRTQ